MLFTCDVVRHLLYLDVTFMFFDINYIQMFFYQNNLAPLPFGHYPSESETLAVFNAKYFW